MTWSHYENKAGYTTNRCGYCWAVAFEVATRLFQSFHITLINQIPLTGAARLIKGNH